MSTTAVYEWQIHGVQPTLVLYLRLARVLNVPLADLLTGRAIPANIHSLCLIGLPHWQNVLAPRRSAFNNNDAARQMKAALKEVPPPSLMAFVKRHGYTHRILRKYFPDQCQAIQQRYREHCAACIEQRRAARIEEFRRVALQLHKDGTELTLNRILTRMSIAHGLGHAIAREFLAEIRREIVGIDRPQESPAAKSEYPLVRRSAHAPRSTGHKTLPNDSSRQRT